MFSGPKFPFSHGMPPRFPHSPPSHFFPRRTAVPGWGLGGAPRMRGGLLAKLFGRGRTIGMNPSPFGPVLGPPPPQTGSFIQFLSNPQSIVNFLANTQKVLNTASQIGSVVQQYGPLIKNLPAMWKIYQGLKNADEDENEKAAEAEISLPEESDTEEKEKTETKKRTPPSAKKENIGRKGQSVPKLYI